MMLRSGLAKQLFVLDQHSICFVLTLNFLVAMVNTLNTKTHSSAEVAEFSFENADFYLPQFREEWEIT